MTLHTNKILQENIMMYGTLNILTVIIGMFTNQ